MAIEYFDNFPSVSYKNKEAKNILLRVGVRESTIKPNYVFMPLTVQEYERPDTVANDLYENSVYDWAIRLVNKQVDPYFDWYLSTEQFEKFLVKKYGSLKAAMQTIVYYQHTTETNITINTTTYDLLTVSDKADYTAVTAYDSENSANETRKNVIVVNPQVIDNMARDLEKKLNE
jgi:hypothetical protein